MKITKQNSSVLVELSQAELSAIELMARMSIESAARLSSIDPVEDLEGYHGWRNLEYCSRFLSRISMNVETPCGLHDFHKVGHEFYDLFMAMGPHVSAMTIDDVPTLE